MQQKPNKKAIGLFFFIGIMALIILIGGTFLSKVWSKDSYLSVLYFDESTQGLHVGSPVVFYGVEVGKVVKISLEANPETLKFKIPVYVELSPIQNMENKGWKSMLGSRDETLSRMIQDGLRARLISQSYLTGQMMIELYVDREAPLHFARTMAEEEEGVLEIPTVLSASEKLSKGLDNLELQTSFDKLNGVLGTLEKQLPELLTALTKSAENLEKITKLVSNDTIDQTNTTLADISAAMKSLRNLTDYLEQYPESLLKGKK